MTLHRLQAVQTSNGWEATVVLDNSPSSQTPLVAAESIIAEYSGGNRW